MTSRTSPSSEISTGRADRGKRKSEGSDENPWFDPKPGLQRTAINLPPGQEEISQRLVFIVCYRNYPQTNCRQEFSA